MKTWDDYGWQITLTKTQDYLRKRLIGDGCERDLVESWRRFYQTHEPVVRLLVSGEGLTGFSADQCAREVWLGILCDVPRLRSPLSHESFLGWLSGLVRTKASSRERLGAGTSDLQPQNGLPEGVTDIRGHSSETQHELSSGSSTLSSLRLNSRIFEMRVVEERSVDDVAAALGLTAQQVSRRQHRMLDQILTILIKLDT
jgi:DNA-directed RNA polymerase specialized sigma24 family protein